VSIGSALPAVVDLPVEMVAAASCGDSFFTGPFSLGEVF